MKALTICQPYAHLICVTREKRVENRTWPTRYRGPLLIHAGKNREWLHIEPGADKDAEYGIRVADMTFGAIIGAATLFDCVNIESIDTGQHSERLPWLREHEHTEGPWCWVLTNRVIFDEPVPWKGAQGLFEVPESAVQRQIDLIKSRRRAG